jgi:hypothetical protein
LCIDRERMIRAAGGGGPGPRCVGKSGRECEPAAGAGEVDKATSGGVKRSLLLGLRVEKNLAFHGFTVMMCECKVTAE